MQARYLHSAGYKKCVSALWFHSVPLQAYSMPPLVVLSFSKTGYRIPAGSFVHNRFLYCLRSDASVLLHTKYHPLFPAQRSDTLCPHIHIFSNPCIYDSDLDISFPALRLLKSNLLLLSLLSFHYVSA